MINLFNYIDRPSPIHRLTGACKLVCLITWSLAAMTSFYTPLLVALTVGSFVLFRIARLKVKDISFMLGLMLVYMILPFLLGYPLRRVMPQPYSRYVPFMVAVYEGGMVAWK